VFLAFEERKQRIEEKQRLSAYLNGLKSILKRNPYLDAKVGLGYDDFLDFTCGRQFYVDKTHFISEWMRSDAKVTLITRPRRLGKTTLFSTVETFFDPKYAKHPEYFEKLRVWKDKKSREMFGKIPVISVSFGSCKGMNYEQSMKNMMFSFFEMYEKHSYLQDSTELSESEKQQFTEAKESFFASRGENDWQAIKRLCYFLYRHHKVLPIILVDEYDTPLLEAYTQGYWDEMIAACRQIFHNSFKQNDYYSRAIITGVARISKNSLFSDLNNLEVDTVTCDAYADCFGFTEQEVTDALKCQNLDKMRDVKDLYDGFIFGKQKDMYNPWSICNYIRQGELISYWTNTSSNKLIGDIIRKHPVGRKYEIEQLMSGEKVHKEINENITFQYLDGDENSLWSLLLSVGYIKAENVVHKVDTIECDVSVTNKEVMAMFRTEILGMFHNGFSVYNRFVKALLEHNIEDMNDYLSEIACTSMSYFDVGNEKEARTPENFYHGLILGLIVTLRDRYRIVSNRESGRGRYDIAMYPLEKNQDAFLMEFKVWDKKKEKNLEETVESAFRQMEEKKYVTDLVTAGIDEKCIYMLGFAFAGKEVLVKEKI